MQENLSLNEDNQIDDERFQFVRDYLSELNQEKNDRKDSDSLTL